MTRIGFDDNRGGGAASRRQSRRPPHRDTPIRGPVGLVAAQWGEAPGAAAGNAAGTARVYQAEATSEAGIRLNPKATASVEPAVRYTVRVSWTTWPSRTTCASISYL